MTREHGCASANDRVHAAANAAMVRYAAGDDQAFAELYELVAPRLRAFLVRRTRDHARAEDLLQQSFVNIHVARGRFCPDGEVMPWAFAIARHLLIDAVRASGREQLVGAEDELCVAVRPAPWTPLEEIVRHRRLMRRVERELVTLPKTYRVAFEIVLLRGLTMAEAARALGTSVNAVKIRTHRAYEALRERLGTALLEDL